MELEFVSATKPLNLRQGAVRLVQAVVVVTHLVVCWVAGWWLSLMVAFIKEERCSVFFLAGAGPRAFRNSQCSCPMSPLYRRALTVHPAHSLSHASLFFLQGRQRRCRSLFVAAVAPIITPPNEATKQRGRKGPAALQTPPQATPRRLTTTQKHGVVKGQSVCEAHMVW